MAGWSDPLFGHSHIVLGVVGQQKMSIEYLYDIVHDRKQDKTYRN